MPTAIGEKTRDLTMQEKIHVGKTAIKDAGFMVHPRYSPRGQGIQVYVLIPIPIYDFSMTREQMAEAVKQWIRKRCEGETAPASLEAVKDGPDTDEFFDGVDPATEGRGARRARGKR